jgi:hypothetical protein
MSREKKPSSSDDDGSVDGADRREVRRGRKKGESGDKEPIKSRDKSSDRRGRSVERKKSVEPIVTLDKNGFPVTLDTKETAEKRRRNRSSSRDGPRRSKSKERGKDLTDEDLSAIKRRSRSSSRDRGIGRTKSLNEKDKTTENSRRGRKKPEGLGGSVHSKSSLLETSKTNSVKGNNTLEKLLSLPKDDNGSGCGGHSVAESRGARTAPARTRSRKKSNDDDGNMSVMSFDNVEEWGSGAKSKKKSSRTKKPASKLILEE